MPHHGEYCDECLTRAAKALLALRKLSILYHHDMKHEAEWLECELDPCKKARDLIDAND